MPTDSQSRKVAVFVLVVTIFFAALTGGFATHAAFTDSGTAAVEFGVAAVNSGTAAMNDETTSAFDSPTVPSQTGDDTGEMSQELPTTAAAVGSFAGARLPAISDTSPRF
ncbi:hypothetical protein [Halalkaliarchaeum desulfuricum]|uniref:hypothetical protein n=1 Tax=Halalkaliarchaeum desulfuricum TaxID=2055893 RepID=UPI00105AB0B4|nr:hypothetical protein [Halalkaliarchaeum desulfuricum]